MRPGVTPHHTSPLLPFQHGTNHILDTAVTDHDINTFSGISKDGKLIWLTRGPVIEILNSSTRRCLASWVFGVALKDTHSYITFVKEYCYDNRQTLLVGVCNASQSSMVCVLDLLTSRVTKVIDIPHKVSSIESVTNIGGDFIPLWALNDQLRLFHGIIAVGTISGIVYLIDMSMDEDLYSDEVMPSKLQYVTPRSRDTAERRKQALSKGHHLCMVLDEESHGNQYEYRRCDGSVLKAFTPDDVVVSCLKYIPQIGTLVVGFSFGSYQLWKLNVPVLEYSSRVEVEFGSVLYVNYQEPENDPKNFCYLWIVRGGDTNEEETISSASLYQLAYNRKTWYSNYGAFYEELTSVSLRFDIDLTSNLFNIASKTTYSSRAITSYTLEDPNYSPPARLNEEESFEESVHGPDLSRCLFVWESTEGDSKKIHQMAVFDMNRWYHAQMPATLRYVGGNLDTCPYLSVHCLDDAIDSSVPDSLLSVHICTETMRKFINTSPLPPEQHFYPSSLAFDALLVVESGVIKTRFLGTQRQVLATMEKIGPSILLNCKELYHLCIYMGLLPRPLDVASHNPTAMQMRENILTMALEYNMLSFIMKCVQDWSPGEYVHHGCTLKFVLDWAWNRVVTLKTSIDNTCTPLYDWSGLVLDNRSIQTLHQAYQKLSHLSAIFRYLLNQASPTTEQGVIELQNKLSVIIYISQHLQVVLWFIGAGLLPEYEEAEESLLTGQYSYPAGSLIHAFDQRRQELQKLHEDIKETDLLLIDGLVSEMGPAVKNLWCKEGGNGLYPPPSLHALLGVYLLEDIDVTSKHALLLYCLLDLVSLVEPVQHEQFSEKISKFTKALGMPFSVIKQVQGFWLLDHKDFEESMIVILNPMVTDDLGDWQHYRIVKSLLYQGESKLALRYISSKQPHLSSPKEVKIKLTVLLANGLTSQALEYQRTYRDADNMEDLLHHLFLGCQQTKTVGQLLQLPLTEDEETSLIQYLNESKEPHSQEMLVLHYLQRARYVEAIHLNEKIKHGILSEPSSKSRERSTARNALIEGFLSLLPEVQRKLVFESQTVPKKNTAKRREVRKPQPLSTTVTKNSHSKIVSRTSLFLEILERVQEVKYEDEEDHMTIKSEVEPQLGPFVCTPITPRTKSLFGHSQPVVYLTKQESNQQKTLPWQPSLTSSMTPFNLTKIMSPVSTKRTSKISGAGALSILQTPVPHRKSLSRSRASTSISATPQSILKVRQFISNTSPQISPAQSLTKVTEVEPSVSSLPGTPRSVSFRDATVQGTPKQLHFVEAKSELKKSSQPVLPKGQRSILKSSTSPKSVKDRSPTPESIARSPKYKSNLDVLPRPPLHEEHMDHSSAEEPHTNMDDVAMETNVEFIDDDITFNYTQNSYSGEESIDSSTEPINVKVTMETQEIEDDQPDHAHAQISILRNTSPVKLKHSPLKTSMTPRSPTVKLTRLSQQGMFPSQFTMPDEIHATSQPMETGSEIVEIDDTDEEDGDVKDDENEMKRHVSFGGVLEHDESINEGNTSSGAEEQDLDEKINEIEDRIFAFSQPEQVEDFDVAEYSLKPKTLFNKVRQREKKLISVVLPDSSSDKEDVNLSSGEDIVVGDSCEEEDVEEKLKENVTTTQDDQDYHLEISDDSEDMELEGDQIIDEHASDEHLSNEHVSGEHMSGEHVSGEHVSTRSETDEQVSSGHEVDVSPGDEIILQSKSEAAIIKDYSQSVDSVTNDIEMSPLQSNTTDNVIESNVNKENENGVKSPEQIDSSELSDDSESKQQTLVSSELSDDSESKQQTLVEEPGLPSPIVEEPGLPSLIVEEPGLPSHIVEEPGLPSLIEIAESDFENKQLPPLFEVELQEEETLDFSSVKERRSAYKISPVHKPVTRRSSMPTETKEYELRRSSRRLSSMAKPEDTEKILSSKKSPGRKKKVEIEKELPKSPEIRKDLFKEELIDNVNLNKSPGRRSKKNIQSNSEISRSPSGRKSLRNIENVEEGEVVKSPGRRKSLKNVDEIETPKSPSRRKSLMNVEEIETTKSPGRRKSVKNIEEVKTPKSPGRRKSIKNVEEIETIKSPGRRKSTKDIEEIETTKSPGHRKSMKNVEEVETPKSPGRRKSTKTIEEIETSKSPGRRKSIKTVEEIEIAKSPGRKKNKKNVEEIETPKSPGHRKNDKSLNVDTEQEELTLPEELSVDRLKSPGRRKGNKTIEEEIEKSPRKHTIINEQKSESTVKKSPGRKKKTDVSFTTVKSPSRKTVEVSIVKDKLQTSLESQSPTSKATQRQTGDQEVNEGELLSSGSSEVESPSKNKDKKNVTPTRSRKNRQSVTPSRKSKRLEGQPATSDMSETETEEIPPPVFSFSDPMEVDIPIDDFTKVKESSDVQSFIFSPPAQTRTKKSNFNNDSSHLVQQEHSILLPSTSRERTPVRSREGTPVKSTSKRGRSKGRSVAIPIPEEPADTAEDEPSDTVYDIGPPAKKEKKSKRGKRKLLNYDEVNLISPIKEEEGEVEVHRPLTRQQFALEMPTMTLRGRSKIGALPKKKRVAKLW